MPIKTKVSQILFPLGGVNKSLAFQSQAPYTTCDACNVRGRDKDFDRMTGGSRPGLVSYAPVETSKPQLLDGVTVKQADGFDFWEDSFQYDSMSHYPAMLTPSSFSTLPSVSNGFAYPSDGLRCGFSIPDISSFDSSKPFRLGVYLCPGDRNPASVKLYFGSSVSGQFLNASACAKMDNSGTAASPGQYQFNAYRIDGTAAGSIGYSDYANGGTSSRVWREGWFEVDVSGASFTLYWNGRGIMSHTLSASLTNSQRYMGVAIEGGGAGTTQRIARVRLQYKKTTASDLSRQRLVSIENGILYREKYFGSMAASNSAVRFSTTKKLASAEIAQKLYILDDPSPIASGTNGVIAAGVFSDSSFSSWSSYFTTANKEQFYFSVEQSPTSSSSGLPNTRVFFTDAEVLESPEPGLIFFAKHTRGSITLTATGGTITLGSTANITISAGADGSSTVTFNSSTADPTPEKYESDIRSACNNMRFDATSTNITSADIQVTQTGWYTSSFSITKPLGITDPIVGRTRYDIASVSSGNVTLKLASIAGTKLSWSLYRCPKSYDITADEDDVYSIRSGTTNGQFRVTSEGTNPDTFTVASITDWDANLRGIDISKYEIQRLSGSTVMARYDITSAPATAYLKISKNQDPLGTLSSQSWQIARKDAIKPWIATRGEVPTGCSLIARYQDRLVLAGSSLEPANWYMSRMSDETDFTYTDTDVGAAVKGSNSNAGTIGQHITALIPYNDDNFFFGAQDSLWLLRGNPAGGGRIDNVSYKIGVVSGTSWCHGPAGEMIWLSRDGIWTTNPTCLSCEPISVSREKLPRELIDINPQSFTISMAYDVRDRGVHIFLTPNVDDYTKCPANTKHWFLHWESKAFWPVRYANAKHNPVFAKQISSPSSEDNCVVMAGLGGGLFRHSWTSNLDELYSISSYVDIGPLNMSDGFSRGMVRSIDFSMAEASNDTSWAIYAGDTAESASSETSAFMSGVFDSGRQFTAYPMMSARAWRLRISGTSGWAFASAIGTGAVGGRDVRVG
mgnify:CR=1 FL=1